MNKKLVDLDLKKIPYNRHKDLVVINEEFLSKLDSNPSNELIDELCLKLNCNRLAVKSKISSDQFRTPNVRLLRGTNSWVTHKDNGIVFGNIKEKLRVSRLDCTDETVVDLFAGIGYFSLVFAVHCNIKRIHLCECNPNAIIALKRNLELNGVQDKCVVHMGDNRVMCPSNVADRVYMGLIPSSLESLEVACRALNPNSAKRILHIHNNVSHFGTKTKDQINKVWSEWAQEVTQKVDQIMSSIHPNCKWFIEILEINKVKAYAPHIDHLVLDLKCNPIV